MRRHKKSSKSKEKPKSMGNALKITYLNKETNIQGDVITEDNLRVGGIINGKCISKGKLIVSEGAVINGDIKGSTVDIYGKVKGNVHSDSLLYLAATSNVEGDCSCKKIKIEEGAFYQGRINKSSKTVSESVSPRRNGISNEILFSELIKGKPNGKYVNSRIKNGNFTSDEDDDELHNGRLW